MKSFEDEQAAAIKVSFLYLVTRQDTNIRKQIRPQVISHMRRFWYGPVKTSATAACKNLKDAVKTCVQRKLQLDKKAGEQSRYQRKQEKSMTVKLSSNRTQIITKIDSERLDTR